MTTEPKKPFIPKQPSSFNIDPHNSRGGKGGKKGNIVTGGGNKKMKSISVPTVKKGGSGGDR